ncbi:MAG: DUF748 domain-containing protein [Candidatus Omnitrophica bacterium]|nr:DUF748 domain-containing protein [Candidatus Omnitrophota bacterium]
MKLIKLFILFVVLVLLACVVLNYHILPVRGKAFLINRLEHALHRDVRIDRVYFSLRKGVVLKDIVIEKKKDGLLNKPLLTADEAGFNVLLLPLITQRKIILTDVHVKHPQLNLAKNIDGNLNISDILKRKKPRETKKSSEMLIASLRITNGRCKFTDYSREDKLAWRLKDISFKYNYSLPLAVKFKASAVLNEDSGLFNLAGIYNLKEKSLTIDITGDKIRLSKISPPLTLPLEIKGLGGIMKTKLKARLNKDKILVVQGTSWLDNLIFKSDSFDIAGRLNFTSDVKYDLAAKEIIAISGDVNFEDALIEGVPYIQTISKLKGKTTYDKEKIAFHGLKGDVLNCPTVIRGALNIKSLYLDLIAKSELNLNKVIEILPQKQKEKFRDLKIKGRSYATLNICGNLRKLISLDMTGDLSLSDVSMESSAFTLTNASGKIFLSKDRVELNNLLFDIRQNQYSLNAVLSDFNKPGIEFKLLSDNLFAAGTCDIAQNIFYIRKIKGNYFKHTFELKGEVTNLESPDFNIYGDLQVDLADIDKLLPPACKKVSSWELKGKCPATFHFQGKPAKWKEASAALKSSAKRFNLKELKLDNFYLNAVLKNQQILLNNLSLDLYDGTVRLSGEMDLKKETSPYKMSALAGEVNLEKLFKDTKLKDKSLSGTAHLKLNLKKPLKDINTILGNGSIAITNGRLLEIPVLSGLAETAGIPAFADMLKAVDMNILDKIVIKEVYGDFRIQNRNITTDNLILAGEVVILKPRGSVDFKGNLNFITTPEISPGFFDDTSKAGKIISMVTGLFTSHLARVETTGTISDPQNKRLPLPTEDLIKKGLKGLEDILKGF